MSTPKETVDNEGVPPPGEPLFRVMYHAADQNTGEPTRLGSGRLRIETTPTQMIRLQQSLSGAAIQALMFVIEHGYKPGQRIEIVGWGGQWLRDHGMRKYESEKAAAELRDKGYIRTERSSPNTPLGRQVGIVPSGHIEEVEDTLGVPRVAGGPKPSRNHALKAVRDTFGPPVSRVPGSGVAAVDESVDTAVDGALSRIAGERSSRIPGNRDDEDVFSQVSAPFPKNESALSTAPTSSGRTEEGLFFSPGQGQALTRADLARFCSQPALMAALTQQWEISVALVAREFAPHATRCAELVGWLGDGADGEPETRLAQIVVDLLLTPSIERGEVTRAQEAFLRSRGVKFRQTTPDDFIAVFVVTMISALDSARPIDSWGGWFGGGLKRDSHFQGKVLAATMAVLNRLLEHPEGIPVAELGASTSAEAMPATMYGKDDPSYVERLRIAAKGTNWEDEVSFDQLLRNPTRQAVVLARYARRTAQGDG